MRGLSRADGNFRDDEGNEHGKVIDEAEFLRECAEVGMFYNWAPPMKMLGGMTQAEYFARYWRPSEDI